MAKEKVEYVLYEVKVLAHAEEGDETIFQPVLGWTIMAGLKQAIATVKEAIEAGILPDGKYALVRVGRRFKVSTTKRTEVEGL